MPKITSASTPSRSMSLARRCGSLTRRMSFLPSANKPVSAMMSTRLFWPGNELRAARPDAVLQAEIGAALGHPFRAVRTVGHVRHAVLQFARRVLGEQASAASTACPDGSRRKFGCNASCFPPSGAPLHIIQRASVNPDAANRKSAPTLVRCGREPSRNRLPQATRHELFSTLCVCFVVKTGRMVSALGPAGDQRSSACMPRTSLPGSAPVASPSRKVTRPDTIVAS